MNRIYQGRVTEVEKLKAGTNGKSPDDWEPFDPDPKVAKEKWQSALWQHHELFQDAVNYYLSAFAAMVDAPNAPAGLREFQGAVIRSWSKLCDLDGGWQMRILRLTLSGRGTWDAFVKRIFALTGSKASAAQRAAAIEAVFTFAEEVAAMMDDPSAILADKLRGKGRSLFPKLKLLCARTTETTPDNVKLTQVKLAHSATKRVKEGGKLKWKDVFAFKSNNARRSWTRKEAVAYLERALDDVSGKLAEYAKSANLREANRSPRIQSPHGCEKALTAAELDSLYQRLRAKRKAFVKILASSKFKPAADGPVRAGSGGFDMKAAMLLASQPDNRVFRDVFLFFNRRYLGESPTPKQHSADPVYAARYAGGVERRVFPFFCDLWAGRLNDDLIQLGVWPDFEKQVFIEVCNKIGQFIITTRRFELRLKEANKIISQMESRLKSDERLQRVQELVETLGGRSVDLNGLPEPYTIRDRTLKAWPKVREAWRNRLNNAVRPVLAKDLIAEKNRLQTRLREHFGSAALFDMLAEEHYQMIWNVEGEADPLEEWAEYADALEEKQHLEEERTFTPAHPLESPRYFRWSETANKTHLLWKGNGKPFLVEVDALDLNAKKKTKLKLSYRAPRLLRDGMRKPDEKLDHKNPDTEWLSPVLRAVCARYGFAPDQQSFQRVAVRLAPFDRTNIQLIFEPEITTDTLARQWREQFPFDAYATKENNGEWIKRGLKWPKTEEGLHALQKHPVTGLMVDLGLNNAGAYHVLRLEAESGDGLTKGLSHPAGPNYSKRQWVIRSVKCGLIKVLGEDRWVWREITSEEKRHLQTEMTKPKNKRNGFCRKFVSKNSKIDLAATSHAFLPELSGSAGRNASENSDETKEAADIFKALGFDIDKRIPDWRERLSFPAQNDELLWALKHVRSQLFRLNKWAEQLSNGEREQNRQGALENIRNLKAHDPLHILSEHVKNLQELQKLISKLAGEWLKHLKQFLPVVANRVLPSRRGTWVWHARSDGWHEMHLDENKPRPDVLLAGQRGLSLTRLLQLRNLRQLSQSLNHLCRHRPGERYVITARATIPEPFEGCRQAMEDAREDRAKQVAHDIFALALGVKLTAPPPDKRKRKQAESLHGIYRCLERGPVNFIALEDLTEYKTSDRRGRSENRQLASWAHRRIHKILQELCEPIGLPIVCVNPALTSRLSAKDHSLGFRAEEVAKNDCRKLFWKRHAEKDPTCGWADVLRLLDCLPDGKTLLVPRRGGPIFVSLRKPDPAKPKPGALLFHADLNAAYRIGLRALGHPDRHELFGTLWLSSKTQNRQTSKIHGTIKKQQYLIDVFGVLPRSTSRTDFRYPVVRYSNAIWDKVDSALSWEQCRRINLARFNQWGIKLPRNYVLTNIVPPDNDDCALM